MNSSMYARFYRYAFMQSLRKTCTFLLFLGCIGNINAQWIQVSDFMGVERDDLVTFTCQNRAFAGSGMEVGYQVTKDFYEYKSDINQWIEIEELPGVARQYSFSFSFDEFGCVFAGLNQSGGDLKDGYLYHPNSNTWNSIAPYPGSGSRSCASANIGKTGYAGLGRSNNQTMHNDWWQYNSENNIWTPKASFPGLARNLAACFESNGFIYVLGGIDENELGIGDAWQYNPLNDSWLALSTLLTQAIGSTAHCKIKYSGAIVGGYDGQLMYTDNAYVFEGFNQTINNIPSIPLDGQRKGAKAFSLNDELYVTCGITSNNVRLKSTWKYNQINTIDNNRPIPDAIQIYPNPAADFAEIFIAENVLKNYVSFSINSMQGQTLIKGTIDPAASKFHLNTSELANGVYFVKLYGNDAEITQKLLIYK